MAPVPVEMAYECSQMGMEVVQEAPALCAEHCSPDHAVAPDTGFAHVPPLALPPVHFEPSVVPPPAHQVLAGQRPVDGMSVVQGESVAVSVNPGGRRIFEKNITTT